MGGVRSTHIEWRCLAVVPTNAHVVSFSMKTCHLHLSISSSFSLHRRQLQLDAEYEYSASNTSSRVKTYYLYESIVLTGCHWGNTGSRETAPEKGNDSFRFVFCPTPSRCRRVSRACLLPHPQTIFALIYRESACSICCAVPCHLFQNHVPYHVS